MKGPKRLLLGIFVSGSLGLIAGFSACSSKQDSPQSVVLTPEVKQAIADEVQRQLQGPETKQFIANEVQREIGKSQPEIPANGPILRYGTEPPLKPCADVAKGGSHRREGKTAAGQSETTNCIPQTDDQNQQ
jgi:hypothetical protein